MNDYISLCSNTNLLAEHIDEITNLYKSTQKQIFTTLCLYNQKYIFLEEHFDRLMYGLEFYGWISSKSDLILLKNELEKILEIKHISESNNQFKVRISFYQQKRKIVYAVQVSTYPLATISNDLIGNMYPDFRNIDLPNNSIKYPIHKKCKNIKEKDGIDHLIFFNDLDEILECESANLILIGKEDQVFIPFSANSYILNGITQKRLIKFLQNKNIIINKISVNKNQLLSYKEVWISNSLIGIKPLRKIIGIDKTFQDSFFQSFGVKFIKEQMYNER